MKRITVCLLMILCVLCSSCDRVATMTWDEFQNLVRNDRVYLDRTTIPSAPA